MPSKKQRRRDEKLRRHEYEWVKGDEVVKPRELRAEKEAAKPKPAAAAAGKKGAGGRSARAQRPVKPASWSRSAKRMGWIGPLFFVFLLVSGGKHKPPIAVALAYAVLLTALFIPFTYWLDRVAYRSYLKRTGAAPPNPPARGRGRG